MSIDFDSAALQTQQDEEEYDQEDYAREQELHKLLTDLPDDMLEDSGDSTPELEYSTCNNNNINNRQGQQPGWTQQSEFSDHRSERNSYENYDDDYTGGADQRDGGYDYEGEAVHTNGYPAGGHPQRQPPTPAWNQPPQEGCGPTLFPHGADDRSEYDQEGEDGNQQFFENQNNAKKHFQNLDPGSGERGVAHYKANYNPHKPACPPQTHSVQSPRQDEPFDHLQREYLDTAHNTIEGQQLAQLQILHKAQQRQIEDLECKLEASRRNMRYIEHQFAIVKDEKDGLAVSLKESSRLLAEGKEREVQTQNQVKSLNVQVQSLTERDHENLKKQRLAEAAVDCMKQQMAELCRSESLARTRQQHDRDVSAVREQHDVALLGLQQKIDASDQALKEQTEVGQRLREQVRLLERQREDEQLERAAVVNGLARRLEETQQQCAKLLQTGSVQEMSQMQIKLQQAQAAKSLSENMNKGLQEDLTDLKAQITMYESAVKHGVIALEPQSEEWEKHLCESYVELGIKSANRKKVRLHSTVSLAAELAETRLPPEEQVRQLRAELQRCLGSLKAKRQRIDQLQQELQASRTQLHATAQPASPTTTPTPTPVRAGPLDVTGAPWEEGTRLQQEVQQLKEQVETLERKNLSLRQSEEKVRAANKELCTKMREMIQELDQEKQEAAQRYERVQQQYRDDVVHRVRSELSEEHQAQSEQLVSQHQQEIQRLQAQVSEAGDKLIGVQECYIAVCKEKDSLEGRLGGSAQDALTRETEIEEQNIAALEDLRRQLEGQHQASVKQLKADWLTEQEAENQQQVTCQVASAKASWKEEQQRLERTWARRLEEETAGRRRGETAEAWSQTEGAPSAPPPPGATITAEELDSKLRAQKQSLQAEAAGARKWAVEEARGRLQAELQKRHVEAMATQVEGAVSRAYGRWLEDLTSLPEYKANLQGEKDQWEGLLKQKASQAESLQARLDHLKGEQAALLRAELAAARAAWTRDKEQEISSLLEGQAAALRRAMEEAAAAAAELQQRELSLAELQQQQRALGAREERRRGQLAETERAQRQRASEGFLAELEACLAELRAEQRPPRGSPEEEEEEEEEDGGVVATARRETPPPQDSVAHVIRSSCRGLVSSALCQAKKEWTKISEERLSCMLRDTQEQHKREIIQIQNSSAVPAQESRCGQRCSGALARLQRKNQELQRHLEKACRQLQHTVRDNKATVQRLKEEQESSLQRAQDDHRRQLEEVTRTSQEASGADLQQGLDQMKQRYLSAVDKIRGDMVRHLQESKERAAQLIRAEVQRERRDTARRMRRHYMSCLQELLQHGGGQASGAEQKIMSAAGRLLAMAEVLETPVKKKPGKNQALPTGCSGGLAASRRTEASTWSSPPGLELPGGPGVQPGAHAAGLDPLPRSDPRGRVTAGSKKFATIAAVPGDPPPGGERGEAGPNSPPCTSATTATRPASAKPRQTSPAAFLPTTSLGNGTREPYLQRLPGAGSLLGKTGGAADTELGGPRFVIRETPVRDDGESDWSSDTGSAAVTRERRQFSPGQQEEFGRLTPDMSDVTVYNELAKRPPASVPSAKRTCREPTPGSEGPRAMGPGHKAVFSALRQSQQDSGFHSPFSQHK